MADASAQAARDDQRRLLILIADDEATMDELITGILDAGIEQASIIEARSLGAVLQRDMPVFAGLASQWPAQRDGRIILCLTTNDRIEYIRRFIDEMEPRNRPQAIVVPVDQSFGQCG